jgi:hypothetical protein
MWQGVDIQRGDLPLQGLPDPPAAAGHPKLHC